MSQRADGKGNGLDSRSKIGGHAFLSYVREDSADVDRLEQVLRNAGVPVWRDTSALWPGEDWRQRIHGAIVEDALAFIACFSSNTRARAVSYQNEELVLAVEQLRLRPAGQPWLIPVRLDNCKLPHQEIGGGRLLSSLHWVDVLGDRFDEGAERLVAGIRRILGPPEAGNVRADSRNYEGASGLTGVHGKPTPDSSDANVLPSFVAAYGPLLDSDLRAVTVEVRDDPSGMLVCSLVRDGDEVVLRRDMGFVGGEAGPYFASASDSESAMRLLLDLDPYSLAMVTPLFPDRSGRRIADMHERAEMGDTEIKATIGDALSRPGMTSIDTIEAWIRNELNLPAGSLGIISVQEHDGRFLLSTRESDLRDLRVYSEDSDYLGSGEPVSYAVITRDVIEELDAHESVEVGYRESPRTWTHDGPRIRVTGMTQTGIPFEEFFGFLP